MADDKEGKEEGLDECLDTVHHLKDQNQELKEENQELRESADTFGELAERLAVKLRKEREAAESKTSETRDPSAGVK